jgi:CHRD domain
MDTLPEPPCNLAQSDEDLHERWPALPWAGWHNAAGFLHGRMPIVGKGRRMGSLRMMSGMLVIAVVMLIFSTRAEAQAAVSPTATLGEGSGTFIAVFIPEGTNPYGTGTAHLLLDPEQQTICYVIIVERIKLPATAAYIHRGAAGINGPIVVNLRPPNAAGLSTGCTHVPRELIVAIMQHSVDYYVNVHNKPHPKGAVRGQLFLCSNPNC